MSFFNVIVINTYMNIKNKTKVNARRTQGHAKQDNDRHSVYYGSTT